MNEKERLASEAARLLAEPLLAAALDGMLGDAFADFKAIKIGPDTMHEVIALQQRILVIQEIPDRIKAVITASGSQDGGVVIESKPTE